MYDRNIHPVEACVSEFYLPSHIGKELDPDKLGFCYTTEA